MYYYKEFCSGELLDCLVTTDRTKIEEKIKNAFDFEVIYGYDITSEFVK